MKKKIRFGLLPRVIAAIVLGVALGGVMPAWCVRIFVTFNALFGQFLEFAVPLIIVGLVAPAIADIGRGAGRLSPAQPQALRLRAIFHRAGQALLHAQAGKILSAP